MDQVYPRLLTGNDFNFCKGVDIFGGFFRSNRHVKENDEFFQSLIIYIREGTIIKLYKSQSLFTK